uniref:Transposable element P transposase-like RNase H C-terminal domain-containing protein n=1 Tax=Schizaphis graminum TaxID=13262 RepID=A0A2S2P3D3_SCHGA
MGNVLQSMYFINPVSKIKTSPQPPTIKNWIKTMFKSMLVYIYLTFLGFQEVFKLLNKLGIKSILLRNFNQDSLENFFGALGALGYRNTNPTCYQFTSSYRTLLLNNLMSSHSPGRNCEEDLGDGCLTSYKTLYQTFKDSMPDHIDEPELRVSDGTPKPTTNFSTDILQDLQFQAHNYIAGFVIKKLNSILFKNCTVCLNQVCSLTTNKVHELTVARDYNPNVNFY